MAATINDLAIRVLKKLKVWELGQSPNPEDILTAEEKLRAVHASIRKDDRVRWTLNSLPMAAEEPYVLMAAFLAGPEFTAPVEQLWWTFGEREINSLIRTKSSGQPTPTEYF